MSGGNSMDKITKEALMHGKVFEALEVFQKTSSIFSIGVERSDIEDFKKFINEYREHLIFEENELFPIILAKGAKNEKELIQKLQEEHGQTLGMINQFDKLFAQQLEKVTHELVELIKEIIETMQKHGHKEDEKLFPVLKKYKSDLF